LKLPTLLLWLLSILADAADVASSAWHDVWESRDPSLVPRHDEESDLERNAGMRVRIGMPDFFLAQFTKSVENVPNYQMPIKYTYIPNCHKMFQMTGI
jgi:hypothetical protein